MKRSLSLLVMSFLSPAIAFAHGVVGQRTFIEPIVAEDANPKNEFDILRPAWTRSAGGRQFSLGFSLEKKLSESGSLSIGSQWMHNSPSAADEAASEGFDNLDLSYKYAILTVPEHEFRLSLAGLTELPTGEPKAGAETHTRVGAEVLWAYGFGDIPNQGIFKYLRPFAIQGDYGYAAKTGGAQNDRMFADNLLEYSLPYLSNFVKDVGLKWPLRNLIFYTEFNYDQIVNGRVGTTFPDLRITPGVAYMDHNVEVSVATQLALNHATVPDDHAAIIGLLDLFLDDIFPWTNWTPF